MQHLPSQNRVSRPETQRFHLIRELAGQHLVLKIVADERHDFGREIAAQPNFRHPEDGQRSVRKDVGLLVQKSSTLGASYQSRMPPPAAES